MAVNPDLKDKLIGGRTIEEILGSIETLKARAAKSSVDFAAISAELEETRTQLEASLARARDTARSHSQIDAPPYLPPMM